MLEVSRTQNKNRPEEKRRAPSRPTRVLCADDNPDTCRLIEVWLSLEGYEVKTVTTASDVLRTARSDRFDVYLLDGRFEDGLGTELIAQIRAFDAETPAIIYSADVRETVRREALKSGAQAFIPKPSDLELVTETIQRLIARAETSDRSED
jgi:CheY-like chemotaxis protein